jgi:DnaK suppressor protein
MPKQAIDTEHFRALLLQLQQELQAVDTSGREAAQTVELDQTRVGRLSRMDALQAQAMLQATNNRRSATLRAIEVAFKAIERGSYGDCIECDEPINPQRLEFDPTVRLCIRCAEELAG